MFFVGGVIELAVLFVFVGGLLLLFQLVFHRAETRCLEDELGTEIRCPRCHHFNPTHANFCGHCGRRLT